MTGIVKDCLWPQGQLIRKLLVYFIDVGQVPSNSVVEFMSECQKDCGYESVQKQLQRQGVATIWLPVRNEGSRIQCIDFSDLSSLPPPTQKVAEESPQIAIDQEWVADLESDPVADLESDPDVKIEITED